MRRLQALRAAAADFGPLRWVVLASAVLPTAGLCVLFANLPALAACWRLDTPGLGLAMVAIAGATGAVLLPPSMAAFAAGYVFGPVAGFACSLVAIALGGVFGQLVVWPLAGAPLYVFMQGRPRLEVVRAFCAAPFPTVIARVAVLRVAARVPFSVVNLLLSAARVPSAAVFAGTVFGALPLAWLASGVGAAYRAFRESGAWPAGSGIASLLAAMAALLAALLLSRRAFQRGSARR